MKKEGYEHYSTSEFVKKYCSDKLQFQPDSEFEYSNSNYYILGAIIEQVTGKKYEEVLTERIFNPLKMKNTGYYKNEEVIEQISSGYIKSNNKYLKARYLDSSVVYSAGAIYSTVEDLFIWNNAIKNQQLLSSDLWEKLFKTNKFNYACGWITADVPLSKLSNFLDGPKNYLKKCYDKCNKKLEVAMHTGGIPGYESIFFRVTNKDQLIVLINNTGPFPLHKICYDVMRVLN
jgi:hypothetical protein